MTPQIIRALLRISGVMYQSEQKDLGEKYASIKGGLQVRLLQANTRASNERLLHLCQTGKPHDGPL